jgi:hypothetical protein
MNQPVIEAQARYLIEDRVYAPHRRQPIHDRHRHRRLRTLSWLWGCVVRRPQTRRFARALTRRFQGCSPDVSARRTSSRRAAWVTMLGRPHLLSTGLSRTVMEGAEQLS